MDSVNYYKMIFILNLVALLSVAGLFAVIKWRFGV